MEMQTPITDEKGNIIPPRSFPNINAGGKDANLYIYPNCITGDTCTYFDNMFIKMKYYLTHNEPLIPNNAYKSVKNNVTDYLSPFYQIITDTVKRTCHFVSINSNNELGAFGNYEWKLDDTDFNNFKVQEKNYATFIKITYVGYDKFQIKMNKTGDKTRIYNVTGKSNSFHLFSRAEKINSKNNKKYLKQLYDFDNNEIANDNNLKSKTDIINVNEYLLNDSLECFGAFYTHFLCDSSESKEIRRYGDFYTYFNVNKSKILAKFQQKKTMFSCEKYKAVVAKISNIEKIKISTMAKFGISSMGIFNCDAISRIKDPEQITAEYRHKKTRKPLNIITIFINVENLNGLIRYDGHYNYGPYKFVYGKNDKCVIIAVDENFDVYSVSPEDFKAATSSQINGHVTFSLTPTGPLDSKENVSKILLK